MRDESEFSGPCGVIREEADKQNLIAVGRHSVEVPANTALEDVSRRDDGDACFDGVSN